MRMFKKDEGFTLVELMVVVLIIGILVAVAIPIFNSASGNARLKTCHSNQRTIEGAVQQYLAGNPTLSWSGDTIDGTDPLAAGQAYLKAAPKCPSAVSATAAFYGVDSSGTVRSDKLASGAAAPTADNWETGITPAHGHF